MQIMKHSQLSGTAVLRIIVPYFVQLPAEQLSQFFFAHGAFVVIHVSILVKCLLQEIHCCEDCLFLCHGVWNKNVLTGQHFLNKI